MKDEVKHEYAVSLEGKARAALNELYRLKEHKRIKHIISDCGRAYASTGRGKNYNLDAPVENPVKPETKARLDKKYLNKPNEKTNKDGVGDRGGCSGLLPVSPRDKGVQRGIGQGKEKNTTHSRRSKGVEEHI